jgi:HK97 family phage portal protein
MGLLERIDQALRRRPELAWPVGRGVVDVGDKLLGHRSEYDAPESYGDYIATSNEVYAAASLRARLMAGLDLQLFSGTGSKKKDASASAAATLLAYVNPFWTRRRLARMDELCMCLWGETYWAVEKQGGQPVELWWLKPSRVRPVPDSTGYFKEFLYEPVNGEQVIPFGPDEMVWFRYPHPADEFTALSPLAAARLAADTSSAMMKSNRNLFSQGLQAGGLVVPDTDKVTFSPEQAAELERLLERRMTGVDKAHRWAVLRYEAQFRSMAVTPKDAEFVNGLQLTARSVWNAYGIPAPLLNDLAHATLANTREYERILWSLALVPDADLRAAEVEEQLLPMFARRPGRPTADHAAYDYSRVPALQESASEAWGRERQAIEIGRHTINEIRTRNGEAPVAWGDVWWAPVNKSAVKDADSRPQGDTTPAGGPDPDEEEPTGDTGEQDEADDAAAEELRRRAADRLLQEIHLNGHPVGAAT